MVTPRNPNDQVTVSPGVLLTIARLSTLKVEGVARMGAVPGGVNRLWRRTASAEGVQILVDDQNVTVGLFVVINAKMNMREVSSKIQQVVARAIREIVGMDVLSINVHVEDVDFGASDGETA